MPRTIPTAILWSREGIGLFDCWTDTLELGKRADGSFRLRLVRVGDGEPATVHLYRSRAFRTGKRLVRELRDLHNAPLRYGLEMIDEEPLRLSEVVAAIAPIWSLDRALAEDTLRALAAELEEEGVSWSSPDARDDAEGGD